MVVGGSGRSPNRNQNATDCGPWRGRFGVRIGFRTPVDRNARRSGTLTVSSRRRSTQWRVYSQRGSARPARRRIIVMPHVDPAIRRRRAPITTNGQPPPPWLPGLADAWNSQPVPTKAAQPLQRQHLLRSVRRGLVVVHPAAPGPDQRRGGRRPAAPGLRPGRRARRMAQHDRAVRTGARDGRGCAGRHRSAIRPGPRAQGLLVLEDGILDARHGPGR